MAILRNINPVGDIDLPVLGRTIRAGEEFEVADEIAAVLLEQVGNYEAVTKKPGKSNTAVEA